MEPRLTLPHDQLDAFCQRWGVSEIYAFGSVTRPDFGPDSDVDVVVRFAPERVYSLFDLDAMREELEAMLGRRVDLLTLRGVEHMPNAARRRAILESMQLIHAA